LLNLFDDGVRGDMIAPEFVGDAHMHFLVADAEKKSGDGEGGERSNLT